MQTLNLPAYDARIRAQDGKQMIFDAVRRKYVRLTPEEWVRQHVVHYLVQKQGMPAGLIAVEKGFAYQGMDCRADVVVHGAQGQPVLMVECKAPDVEITQAAFDQVARYNKVIAADYLVVTNGLDHYCWYIDREEHAYRFLDQVPDYEELRAA